MKKFLEEGDNCPEVECAGNLHFPKTHNCSCHISPPCSSCTDKNLVCNTCGFEVEEEKFNDFIIQNCSFGIYSWKPRELDTSKIDWYSKPHSNSSMITEGVYPEGTTMKQVLEKVEGTFGGRFEYFENGKFKYIAYTD